MVSSFLWLSLLGMTNALDLTVSSQGGNASSPLMYGLMYEDINHSGDGGIYAELIQNRAFQGSRTFPSTLKPWTAVGGAQLTIDTSMPLSALPNSVKVASGISTGAIGISNPGWWGISIKPQKYSGSFWVSGEYSGNFTLKLQSDLTSDIWATLDLPSASKATEWTEHKFELTPIAAAPNSNNSFVLEFDSGSSLNFNLISLFPPTYNDRPNGNRPELMKALKELGGSFFRIPGGNNL
jgi:alpha-N-arabinofuranosidase